MGPVPPIVNLSYIIFMSLKLYMNVSNTSHFEVIKHLSENINKVNIKLHKVESMWIVMFPLDMGNFAFLSVK